MVASVQSPADLANIALVRMGWKGPRVASLFDGSEAAQKFLDLYAQTRDELLRNDIYDWGFAERNLSLNLLKFAPVGGYFPPNTWNPATNPPPGWLYEYTYPDDCLKVRAVKPVPLFGINWDPQPVVFSIDNDSTFIPPQRVILCNVQNAVLVYTGRVTDPTTWDVSFVAALATKLERYVAAALVGMEGAKMAQGDEAQAMQIANTEQG
jgi:hypothetical protein